MGLKYRFVWGMEGRVNQFPDNVFRALKKERLYSNRFRRGVRFTGIVEQDEKRNKDT